MLVLLISVSFLITGLDTLSVLGHYLRIEVGVDHYGVKKVALYLVRNSHAFLGFAFALYIIVFLA
mgnify:CR=1 FL=1|jgi:hypothetical protein|tara:strand:- start:349 stop:543 length:195 start_codon:yes stop_codon:yes gene_type:complete